MTFGERLITARENKNYKQNQLAELLGITATRLNYWEKDKREPDVLMIKKLSSLLEVSSDWLIGNENINNFEFTTNEKNIIKKYRNIDFYGQKLVNNVIDIEYERCINNSSTTESVSINENEQRIKQYTVYSQKSKTPNNNEMKIDKDIKKENLSNNIIKANTNDTKDEEMVTVVVAARSPNNDVPVQKTQIPKSALERLLNAEEDYDENL